MTTDNAELLIQVDDTLKYSVAGTLPGTVKLLKNLAAAIRSLEADAKRLDFLEDVSKIYNIDILSQPSGDTVWSGQGSGLRAAIDEARKGNRNG